MAPVLHVGGRVLAAGRAACRKRVLRVQESCCVFVNLLSRAAALSSSPRGLSSSTSNGIPPFERNTNSSNSSSGTSEHPRAALGSSTCRCVNIPGESSRGGTSHPSLATSRSSQSWGSSRRGNASLRHCESSTLRTDLRVSEHCNGTTSSSASCTHAPGSYPPSCPPRLCFSHGSSTARNSWNPLSSVTDSSSSRKQCSSGTGRTRSSAACSGRCSGGESSSDSKNALSAFCMNESLSAGACVADAGFVSGRCSSRRLYSGSAYWGEKLRGKQYSSETVNEWKTTFPHLSEYDNESLQAWRRVFDAMDRDSDGYLSQADLQKTPDFTLAKAQKLRDYDADQNNLIDFGEFVKALYNVDKEMFLESFEGFDPVDIQLEFDKYSVVDEASPTKKHIPESRVELIMQHNKFTCITAPDIKRLFKELDVNGDGVIDFSDFQQCVQRRG